MTAERLRWPARRDVLGTPVSITAFEDLIPRLEQRYRDRAVVVNVCNVHSVMSARTDQALAAALRTADANTPDGMPLAWYLRSLGEPQQPRVNGYDLTTRTIEHGLVRGWRHYFYGASPETLAQLRVEVLRRWPSIEIAGMHAPPFRSLSTTELEATGQAIRDTTPDVVWVGLGMPKQEKWMADMRCRLPGTVLIGIGAVFDFLAGTKAHAPGWMQRAGLEWLFRLGTEPRRLWRRYLWNNPAFLSLWARDVVRFYTVGEHTQQR